jgi:hypothetical protein
MLSSRKVQNAINAAQTISKFAGVEESLGNEEF